MVVTRRNKQAITALSILAIVGLLGLQLTSNNNEFTTTTERAMRRQLAAIANGERHHRRLSNNGPSPPLEDIADGSYIVKPSIGASFTEVFETMDQTTLAPPDATASNYNHYTNGSPLNVLDGLTSTSWKSHTTQSGIPTYLDVDLGIPEEVAKVEIQFQEAAMAGIDFELQCRDAINPEWRTLDTRIGVMVTNVVFDQFVSPDNYCRYLRFLFTSGYTAIATASPTPAPTPQSMERFMSQGDATNRIMYAENELLPGEYIVSPDGRWKLRYAEDGNLILSDAGPTNVGYWDSGTWNTGKPAGKFILQADGNLIIYASDGTAVWATATEGNSGAWFKLQNDRNLVLVSASGQVLWTPNTYTYSRKLLSSPEQRRESQLENKKYIQEGRKLARRLKNNKYQDEGVHRELEGGESSRRGLLLNPQEGHTTGPYIGVAFVKAWRMPRVASTVTTTNSCGSDFLSVKSTLLSRNAHGGVLQEYLNAEFFSVSMTAAQADVMREDPCAYAVEPNYIIRARGSRRHTIRAPTHNQKPPQGGATILKGQEPSETQRRLGVPEFNLKDSSPGNWGLERISTRGVRNGKYIWVSEGFGTDVYVFDTGIHDSYEFTGRNVTWGVLGPSRIEPAHVCAGNTGDEGEHGSFIASIIGGKKYGVARMAAIHPMQILDVNGEGSLATFLCGMEKLIQDGIDYYTANAPKSIKAVVNLSVGTNGKSDILDKAAEDLVALGYTVVIAAGDNGGNACHYSPTTPNAIRVGALKDGGLMGKPGSSGANQKTDTSNYGECIDIWAPGEDIVGANEEDWGTVTMSGTSVAAAFTSGTITMFLEEILASENPQTIFPIRAKDKMLTRSERDALGDVGVYGTNRVLQTTSSPCLSNIHCESPKICMYDGACGVLGDYFQ